MDGAASLADSNVSRTSPVCKQYFSIGFLPLVPGDIEGTLGADLVEDGTVADESTYRQPNPFHVLPCEALVIAVDETPIDWAASLPDSNVSRTLPVLMQSFSMGFLLKSILGVGCRLVTFSLLVW